MAIQRASLIVNATATLPPLKKPGGQALILDLRKDASRSELAREVDGMHLSPFTAWLTRWIFRLGLLRAAYTTAGLQSVVAHSRFAHGDLQQPGIGFELRLTK